MYLSAPPFLYRRFLAGIEAVVPGTRPIVLWSGRNLGKTTVLRRLLESLDSGEDPQLIRGRSVDAPEEILAWVRAPRGVLLLDDFDQLRSDEAQGAVLELLVTGTRYGLVVSVRDPENLPVPESFDRVRLDPWSGDWQDDLTHAVTASVNQLPGGSGVVPLDSEVLSTWIDTIRDVTGGYPALVHASVLYFAALLTDRAGLNTPSENRLLTGPGEDDLVSWKTLLRVHLEDHLVDRTLPLIRHTVRDLRKHRPDLFDHLLSLARGQGEIDDSYTRKELRDTGLAYTRDDGRLGLASPLIGQWIRHCADQGTHRHPAARLRTGWGQRIQIGTSGSDPYEGMLVYTTAENVTGEIAVTGGPWRLLRCLAEAGGEPLSVKELSHAAGLGTETAVRSALQRLQKLFRDNRLSNVIDNVRGHGYRLSSFPALEPP